MLFINIIIAVQFGQQIIIYKYHYIIVKVKKGDKMKTYQRIGLILALASQLFTGCSNSHDNKGSESRHLKSKDGSKNISIDYMVTEDNKKVPFNMKMFDNDAIMWVEYFKSDSTPSRINYNNVPKNHEFRNMNDSTLYETLKYALDAADTLR